MENRRPIASRGKEIFHQLARLLVKLGLHPNHISLLSMAFAGLGFCGFWMMSQGEELIYSGGLVVLLGIQLRLVCNLVDGLMAVEGKLGTPQGEIYNDAPDRVSDVILILGLGFVLFESYGLWGWHIAWAGGVAAVLTAYIRVLGASLGVGHDFSGPMAKQHRMAVLNLGVIGSMVEAYIAGSVGAALLVTAVLIFLGSVITTLRRLIKIYSAIGRKSS